MSSLATRAPNLFVMPRSSSFIVFDSIEVPTGRRKAGDA
jgi:hypothetical protein